LLRQVIHMKNMLSEQFQNLIAKCRKNQNRYSLQKYMTAHLPGLVQVLQKKVAGLS
jgi:hypothetical protein